MSENGKEKICFISFSLSESEKMKAMEYVKQKKRWKTVSDLSRDAFWQFIARNKPGSHRKGPGKDKE